MFLISKPVIFARRQQKNRDRLINLKLITQIVFRKEIFFVGLLRTFEKNLIRA
jgi:hypothetical protein